MEASRAFRFVTLLLLGQASGLTAEEPKGRERLVSGARISVEAPAIFPKRVIARLVTETPEAITVVVDGLAGQTRGTVIVPRASITTLKVSRGRSPLLAVCGGLLGGFVGMTYGGHHPGLPHQKAEIDGGYILAFGLAGIVGGAKLGARERWQDIRPQDGHLRVTPQ